MCEHKVTVDISGKVASGKTMVYNAFLKFLEAKGAVCQADYVEGHDETVDCTLKLLEDFVLEIHMQTTTKYETE